MQTKVSTKGQIVIPGRCAAGSAYRAGDSLDICRREGSHRDDSPKEIEEALQGQNH
jgi:bifunctional DNA-binding transcriptional regulator/antitoxin component of YhaV-PrlF toxin-antitoxin module